MRKDPCGLPSILTAQHGNEKFKTLIRESLHLSFGFNAVSPQNAVVLRSVRNQAAGSVVLCVEVILMRCINLHHEAELISICFIVSHI